MTNVSITTTASKVAAAYKKRRKAFDRGRKKGMRRLAARTEKVIINDYLTGGKNPGDYPVPRVRGKLVGSIASHIGTDEVVVYSDPAVAEYNRSIAAGFHPYGNENAEPMPPRPFMADAFDDVQDEAADIVRGAIKEALR